MKMNLYEERERMAEEANLISVSADDVLNVVSFIVWHDKTDLWGGTKRDEAFESFCRLVGIKDPDRIFKIVRKEEDV
jgi:hypothetical protein